MFRLSLTTITMTLFARYYLNNKLFEYSMNDIQVLINSEENKEKIADLIFHRYYDRYLKLFYYNSKDKKIYTKVIDNVEVKEVLNKFNTEFKSGFAIMTNCCLLIEAISTYFEGTNRSTKKGRETFKEVFKKARQYSNDLAVFENTNFYEHIRCGLLHQGETYGKFKIRREGILFDVTNSRINANKFCSSLKSFLESYKDELITAKWDSEIWDNCRNKLRHIIRNCQ